jgi:hypothetical protein
MESVLFSVININLTAETRVNCGDVGAILVIALLAGEHKVRPYENQ